MAKEIKIPIADQTTEEVRIVKWHKAVGEQINSGQVVLEIETDKSVIEVESPGEGVLLEQKFAEDDMVPVGDVVGMIGEAGETVAEAGSASAPATAPPASKPGAGAAASVPRGIKISPAARKIAKELGVDVSSVVGTGPGGKITRGDVEQAAKGGRGAVGAATIDGRAISSPNARRLARELGVEISAVPGTGPGGRIIGADVEAFAAANKQAPAKPAAGGPVPGTEVAMSRMRRAIGVNLQKSSRDTPHFNVTVAINMSRAMQVRAELNKTRDKGGRISVNDLVVKACAVGLRHFPAVNSRLGEDKIEYLADVNIGVATAVPDGLVVPVVSNVDELSWDELASQTKRAAQEARKGKIIGAGKGTFTVSNLGMFGVESFTAIINPPESAILAVGGIADEVVAIAGGIGVQPMMRVTLCSDHRIVDGALAAEFCAAMKLYLEEQIS